MRSLLTLSICLMAIASCAAAAVEILPDESGIVTHVLETRVARNDNWVERGKVTTSVNKPKMVKFQATEDAFGWDNEKLGLLKELSYFTTRVRYVGDEKGAEASSILVSPCALITSGLRSNNKGHYLHESYSVLLDPRANNTIIGLQFSADGREDLCDLSVLDALRGSEPQSVSVSRVVQVKVPAEPQQVLLDPGMFGQGRFPPGGPAAVVPPKKKGASGAAAGGATGKKEEEEEEQPSFLQRYWWVGLLFLGIQIAGAVMNPQQQGGGGGGK